jgi:Aspartyl protease
MTESNQALLDERGFLLHQEIQPAQAPVLGDGPALLKLTHSINQRNVRMMKDCDTARVDRRKFLRTTASAFSAAAFLQLLECRNEAGTTAPAATQSTSGGDPDQLFRSGRFAEADWGYKRVLAGDPKNVHALARRGLIALLSNKFAKTEHFLHKAIRLAPEDNALKLWLADCFVRQDDFARAVPLLRDAGNQANADQYDSITGEPYEVCGAMATRLPFLVTDPTPVVEAAVNGIAAAFTLDTGATLAINSETARAAGIREVAVTTPNVGFPFTFHLGVMDSFQLAGIELRNVPILWHDLPIPPIPGLEKQPVGAIGTTIFYHFLSTMDFANGALILRRKTNAQLRAFQAEAISAGATTAPLWMAPDHFLFSRGSINDFGPGLFAVDTGGPGVGVGMTDEIAAKAGVVPDFTMPRKFRGPGFDVTVYPCVADVSLGTVVRRDLPGIVGPLPSAAGLFGFESIATISHEFFRPLAVTFDFVNMTMYIRN